MINFILANNPGWGKVRKTFKQNVHNFNSFALLNKINSNPIYLIWEQKLHMKALKKEREIDEIKSANSCDYLRTQNTMFSFTLCHWELHLHTCDK